MRPRVFPINYTLSITNVCPSRCKTCFIWKIYEENPTLKNKELSTSDWERIIENLGSSPFWVTLSGGEPFARKDIVKICKVICEVNKPKIINIPTNGILYERIRYDVPKILDSCEENNVALVVNISIDEIGERHDEIRGVKNNWDAVLKTLSILRNVKSKSENIVIGVHSVISNYNVVRLPEIAKYIIEKLKPDHYIMEVAEERSELFNKGANITPTPLELKKALDTVMRYLEHHFHSSGLERLSQAFRSRYYSLVPIILAEKRQIIPCMASFASCQITPFGDLWACCILGYENSLGNLREANFNFKKVWKTRQAKEIRRFIREKRCACPLANAHYTNFLLNIPEISKIALKIISENPKEPLRFLSMLKAF